MAVVMVVGLSVRALSQSARRAGYTPLAADLFCDLDTREMAEKSVRIDCNLESGIEWPQLAAALESLSAGREPVGLVYGSGFEDRTDLLGRIAAHWPLLGNSAEAVGRVTDPEKLAELCVKCDVPYPDWSKTPIAGWLSKQVGGAGGSHVGSPGPGTRRYWQERVDGDPVSAVVLANGERAIVLGLSAQWADPAPTAAFRYGGAVRPAELPSETANALEHAAIRVIEAAGLVGLNSADFLVAEDGWDLIEINPRPGATLDIFHSAEPSLFAMHVEACRGRLPSRRPEFVGAAAARIVYASRDVERVPEFDWPEWAADRQPSGTSVARQAPLCTVLAEADTAAEARRLVEERGRAIAAALGAI
jgi:predicted ATP-grasp superfamily ATP-dependent carboligase